MSTTPVNPTVEMLINGIWVDITPDCRLRSADSGGGFEISRGVPNEGSQAEPVTFGFTLNNGPSKVPSTAGQSGCYSPRNPLGPYYGYLGRNQRVRIGLDRRLDSFTRTTTQGLGSLPAQVAADGATVVPAMPWRISGSAATWSTNGSEAVIAASGVGPRYALTDAPYADVDLKMRVKCSSRDTEFGFQLRNTPDYVTPPVGAAAGTFETGLGVWAAGGSSVVSIDLATPHSGTQCAKVTVAGSPTTVSFSTPATASTLWTGRGGALLTAGVSYRVRMWVRTSIAMTVNGNVSFYDENLAFLGAVNNGGTACAANTWTLIDYSAVAVQDAAYARPGPIMQGSPANGTTMLVDDVEFLSDGDSSWYSVNFVPALTDYVKFGKVSSGTSIAISANWGQQLVANTYYWMHAQIAGQRLRMKLWKDGDPVPTTWLWRWFDDETVARTPVGLSGSVGFFAGAGSGTVTVDSFEINQWRAHTEIAELPPRWDLSRSDRWVPILSKGILRRLGQGRKQLRGAVSLHLQSYASLTKAWWPLDGDTGDSAGNNVAEAGPASILNLTFNEPALTGPLTFPGISGYATLDQDNSYFLGSVPNHVATGKSTFLWFAKLPGAVTADATMCTITSTGTAQQWVITIQPLNGLKVEAFNSVGGSLASASSAYYFLPAHPVGCWLAFTLYLFQSGGNVVWALNFHKPGEVTFWTLNGSFAGTVGINTGIQFRSNALLTAAGDLSITQVLAYAGDLPFVSYDFEKAAYAYQGELSTLRAFRLATNAGVPLTTTGLSSIAEPMGFQLPAKLLELLGDCADAEHGILIEDRDDFGLVIVTRDSLWNRYLHAMSIDSGHLSPPLEPSDDDKGTRNDVTMRRTNGGFARSIQLTGPLNVSPPELDPVDGVGVYDEAPQFNMAFDAQLQFGADFRRSRGTQGDARYPVIHADLTATVYQAAGALAAVTRSMDVGDIIYLANSEVSADPAEQQIQSYVEQIDLFDYDISWVATPARVFRVGVVGYTTRLDTVTSYTTVTPTALNANPFFESSVANWVGLAGTIVRSTAQFHEGGASMQFTPDGINSTPRPECDQVAGPTPGTRWVCEAWVMCATARTVTLNMNWFDASHGYLSTVAANPGVLAASTWTYISVVGIAPASAAYVSMSLDMPGTPPVTHVMWVDAARIYQSPVAGTVSFISGTDTKLKVARADVSLPQWVYPGVQPDAFPFNIDVSGVRLKVITTGDLISLNPTLDAGLANWGLMNANGTLATERAGAKYGARCARVTCTVAGVVGIYSSVSYASVPGETYYTSAWVKTSVAITDARVGLDWYQSDGVTGAGSSQSGALALAANTWTYISWTTTTTPALGVLARMVVRTTLAVGDRMWVDQPMAIGVTSYMADPQTLTVEQAPVNGVIKTITTGRAVRLADPWRPAW